MEEISPAPAQVMTSSAAGAMGQAPAPNSLIPDFAMAFVVLEFIQMVLFATECMFPLMNR
jgi:hypothetical protein